MASAFSCGLHYAIHGKKLLPLSLYLIVIHNIFFFFFFYPLIFFLLKLCLFRIGFNNLFCLPDLWDIAKEICRTVDAWFDKIK
jgi:hypothetical protein